jgi:hypothetical protein
MLRRLPALLVLGSWVATKPVKAQEAGNEPNADRPSAPAVAASAALPAASQTEAVERHKGWDTFVSGYFRVPLSIGISPRPGPHDPNGPAKLQLSYGPTRVVDANYYSFAYTRLQEQDWAEVFVHAKRKHVEAVVGWMGYWYQSAAFRNPDASWVPGMAYVTLDTDLGVGGVEPNIAFTAGAWWPKFGYFEKYDTYTLGQFRQMGEQLKLTLPVNPDLTLTAVQGFGTSRDGSFVYQITPAIYGAKTGLKLLHYEHLSVAYKEYVEVGLHYNNEWTRDPNLFQQSVPGRSYAEATRAHVTTMGAEARLSAPYAGRLWISPSYVAVENGWALGANGGTEVMHSLSGDGLATNYLGWSNSPSNSTGSGSLLNLGFLYENTLSGVQGQAPGSVMPEVTLNVFGLLTSAELDLPAGTTIPRDRISQFKYGADVTVQALDWLGFMLRWDEVNYDLDNSGYQFSAITPRVTFSSHFLSGESIYIQYSRYRYGDEMVLAGDWPWGTPLVAGSEIIQAGPYAGQKPDMDVVKLQAEAAF